MGQYRCGSCNYRFEPRGDREPKICPYCSEHNVRPEKGAFDVDRFLEE